MLNQGNAIGRQINSPTLISSIDLFQSSSRLGRVRYIGLLSFWFSVIVISAFCSLVKVQDMGAYLILFETLKLALMIPVIIAAFHIILIKKRRFNDFNCSGWWMLWGLIPGVGLLLILYLGIKPGSKDANKFGAPNKKRTRFDYALILMLPIVILLVNLLGLEVHRS